jgi:phosphonate transport system permease protein
MKLFKALLVDFLLWMYSLHAIVFFLAPDLYNPLVATAVAVAITALGYFVKSISIGMVSFGQFHYPTDAGLIAKPVFWLTLFHLGGTIIVGSEVTQVSFYELFSEDGLAGAGRIFRELVQPNFDIIGSGLMSAIETLYMSFLATFFAIPISFLLSFFGSRNLTRTSILSKLAYVIVRFSINITRSIEPLLWAIIFSVWVGIGPFAGMLALMLHSIASLTKLYSEQIESIDEGPVEAMTATGAHPVLIIWYGVVPQVVLPFLSYTIYRWDINVRMATVIGLVGGGGIGNLISQYQQVSKWNEVGMLVFIIAFIVWLMDYASAMIRQSIK